MGFWSRFPKKWLVDVTVVRSGGRDPKGNLLPEQRLPVTGCLISRRATTDPVDRSEVVDAQAVLYRAHGFKFYPTDRIEVPDGTRMAGKWAVDGIPGEWPQGVEVGLVRA